MLRTCESTNLVISVNAEDKWKMTVAEEWHLKRFIWHKCVHNKILYFYATKSLQSYLTLCDPIDGSPPGSPIPGILQARTLEWVAISFSNAWKWKVKVKSFSHVWPSVTSDPQRPHGLQPTRPLRPWDFPGKSAGVGCHCLLWCTHQPVSIITNIQQSCFVWIFSSSLPTLQYS